MAIRSEPFGGTTLTGEDAEAFLRQVAAGVSKEKRQIIAESVKRGIAMAEALRRDGYVRMRL